MPDPNPYAAFADPVQAPPPAATPSPQGLNPYAAFADPVQPAKVAAPEGRIASGPYAGLSQSAGALQAQIDPLNAQREQAAASQARADQSAITNLTAGLLHPHAGVAGGNELALGHTQAANNTLDFAPAPGSIPGEVGEFIGGLPTKILRPLGIGAAYDAANEAAHQARQVELARQRGENISNTAALEQVGGQATLQGVSTYLMGKNITGQLGQNVLRTLTANPSLIEKLGMEAAVQAALSVNQGGASDLISQQTVAPQTQINAEAPHRALIGAAQGFAGGAVSAAHDAYSKFATPVSPPAETAKPAEPTEAAKPIPPVVTSEQVPTNGTALETGEGIPKPKLLPEHEAIARTKTPRADLLQEQAERAFGGGTTSLTDMPDVGGSKPNATLARLTGRTLAGSEPTELGPKEALANYQADTLRRKNNAAYHEMFTGARPVAPEAAPTPQPPSDLTDEQLRTWYAGQEGANPVAPIAPPEQGTEGKPGLLARAKAFAANEEGGTQAAKNFVEQDVKPAAAGLGKGIAETYTGVRRALGVHHGVEGLETALKQRGSEAARLSDQLNRQYGPDAKALDKLSDQQLEAMRDRYERGQPQGNAEHDQIMGRVQDINEKAQDMRLAVNPNAAEVANFLARRYEDPQHALPIIEQILAKKPLGGKASFNKERELEFESDARKLGLKLVEPNPVRSSIANAVDTHKWASAVQMVRDQIAKGELPLLPANGRPPAGFTSLDTLDPMLRGRMAPDEQASVLKNALSQGLGKYAAGRAVRKAGNLVNMSNMALSLRHGEMSINSASVSNLVEMFKSLFRGEGKAAARQAALGITQVGPAFRDAHNAEAIKNVWYNPESGSPEDQMIVKAGMRQGMRVEQDPYYDAQMTRGMTKAIRSGNPFGAALRAPFALLEKLADPIMKHLVPDMKLGAFREMGMNILRQHPDWVNDPQGHIKLDEAMKGKGWGAIDDLYGQIAYDNQFMHRTVKDAFMMGMRALGWRGGSARTLLGGVKDLATETLPSLVRGKPELSEHAAQVLGITANTVMRGAILTYLFTGKGPQTLKDYVYPPLGYKDKHGDEARLTYPGYHNDAMQITHDPIGYAESGLHPLVQATHDLLQNKDFTGTQITKQDDPLMKKMLRIGGYLGKEASPFSVQNLERGKGVAGAVSGIMEAPSYATASDAEQQLYKELDANQRLGGRTPEETARTSTISTLAGAMRNKDPDFNKQYTQALKDGTITRRDFKAIEKRADLPEGLKGEIQNSELKPDALMRIWKEATPEEQKAIRYYIRKRVIKAPAGPDFTEANRKEYLQETANAPATQPAD